MEGFLKHAAQIYAYAYFGAILVVSLLEWGLPRRHDDKNLRVRWLSKFGITVLDTLFVRLLFPVVGVGWAVVCAERQWGLFNRTALPAPLAFALSILVLDLVSYTQHVVLHRVPLLWRAHRTHHTDLELDFTTGVRFHPFETVFSTAAMLGAIALLGVSPLAALSSQLLSFAITLLEHSNVNVPAAVDRILRLVAITP